MPLPPPEALGKRQLWFAKYLGYVLPHLSTASARVLCVTPVGVKRSRGGEDSSNQYVGRAGTRTTGRLILGNTEACRGGYSLSVIYTTSTYTDEHHVSVV